MNKTQNSNLVKLVAFFLISIILTCTVAYASGGRASKDDVPKKVFDNPDEVEKDPEDDNDRNENENTKPDDPPTIISKQYHYITGEEIPESSVYNIPLAFVCDFHSATEGLLSSYLTVEIPTEGGQTRFIAFTDDALREERLGTLISSRDYINDVISYFGGMPLYFDNDYQRGTQNSGCGINLKECLGYYYTGPEGGIYTSSSLLSSLFIEDGIPTVRADLPSIPFLHCPIDEDKISYQKSALNININYSENNGTVLKYSQDKEKYILLKGDTQPSAEISDLNLYDNAFVLFADSYTYESSDSTLLSLMTNTKGKGLYITAGTYLEINWSVSAEGELVFQDSEGNKLTVNRGRTYISYLKSSEQYKLSVE